jgi:hypothetical protein
MSSWKPALALLLVFVAGMAVGVVGTRAVVRRVVQQYLVNPDEVRQNQLDIQLARRLRLGPLQRPRVREILAEMQGQLKLIREETQPRRAMVVSNAETQIEAILRPAQLAAFQQMKAENRLLSTPGLVP